MGKSKAIRMRTALYDEHLALGAKMVDFAGWEMPLSYQGIVHEHLVVRRHVGLFDVSHMGRILVTGPEAEAFLDFIATNIVAGQSDHHAIYTVMATHQGGSVDDVIIYRETASKAFVIVNASNRIKDLEHLTKLARSYSVRITARYDEDGIIAVQGPKAESLARKIFPGCQLLNAMEFNTYPFQKSSVIVSRTGYTGSGGYEVIASNALLPQLWRQLLTIGRDFEVEPIGLGARDTLRLEAGYALYGHELADDIAPTESISSWTVKWKKGDFLGQEALLLLQHSPDKRSQHGVALLDEGVPRAGCPVYKSGRSIGVVTSGSHSPSLQRGIAIVMVSDNLAIGETVEIEVRNRRLKGEVHKLPFYKA